MYNNFDNFDIFDNFKTKEDLEQYSSYAAYNNDLLRLADCYGRTPFDWYRNKITGEIKWLDGKAEICNYSNLGHTWGKTFANNSRILLDGETKLITYNGEVLYDFNKKKPSFFSDGIAMSDRGNYQNPGALPKGGRNVTWIDFGGALEALLMIFAFEIKNPTPKGKGTNGGKPTQENKVDDGVTAVDFGASAAKTIYGEAKAKDDKPKMVKKKDSVRETFYSKDGTEIRSLTRLKKDNE